MIARTFDHNRGTTQSALRKLSAKASHQHFRSQLAYTKQVPRTEWGVRDRPENGCFALQQNEMVPQRPILCRKHLFKWFFAVTPLKEENVHITKTIILALSFLII